MAHTLYNNALIYFLAGRSCVASDRAIIETVDFCDSLIIMRQPWDDTFSNALRYLICRVVGGDDKASRLKNVYLCAD